MPSRDTDANIDESSGYRRSRVAARAIPLYYVTPARDARARHHRTFVIFHDVIFAAHYFFFLRRAVLWFTCRIGGERRNIVCFARAGSNESVCPVRDAPLYCPE